MRSRSGSSLDIDCSNSLWVLSIDFGLQHFARWRRLWPCGPAVVALGLMPAKHPARTHMGLRLGVLHRQDLRHAVAFPGCLPVHQFTHDPKPLHLAKHGQHVIILIAVKTVCLEDLVLNVGVQAA